MNEFQRPAAGRLADTDVAPRRLLRQFHNRHRCLKRKAGVVGCGINGHRRTVGPKPLFGDKGIYRLERIDDGFERSIPVAVAAKVHNRLFGHGDFGTKRILVRCPAQSVDARRGRTLRGFSGAESQVFARWQAEPNPAQLQARGHGKT